MMPRTGDVVEVEWLDSEHLSIGWADVSRYVRATVEPQSYRTSGYWIDGAGDHVLIAQSVDPANRAITHCMSIPKVAVTNIVILGHANKQVRKALGA